MLIDVQDMLLSGHRSTFRRLNGYWENKLQLNILARENLQWSTDNPLQGELVTLLDALCFRHGMHEACHWSMVSFQTTPFLNTRMDFMCTCDFWSSGLTNYWVLAETSDFQLNPNCTFNCAGFSKSTRGTDRACRKFWTYFRWHLSGEDICLCSSIILLCAICVLLEHVKQDR